MKKQELIHLHGVLAEVSVFCESDDRVSIDYDAYQSVGVRPTSIHHSKTDHKAAVFALSNGIVEGLRSVATDAPIPSAD